MKYYPLGDKLPDVEDEDQHKYMAKFIVGSGASGMGIEFRPPKKGEWYLSGSIPVAFLAPNDLNLSFHIMRVVKVRKYEVIEEV